MCDLQSLAQALRMIEQLDSSMPIRQLMCLIRLAQLDEPLHQRDIARITGLSLSATSRYVQAFGPQGLGLVTNDKNPHEGRCRVVELTGKGRQLISAMTEPAAVA